MSETKPDVTEGGIVSLQEILRRSGSPLLEDEFLQKLWEERLSDKGDLKGGLIKAVRKITGLSEHFGKQLQECLVDQKFASKSTNGSGSAPGWKLNPAKFVKSEPQEMSAEEPHDLYKRLVDEKESRRVVLDQITGEVADFETAESIVTLHHDPEDPEKLKRVFAIILQRL